MQFFLTTPTSLLLALRYIGSKRKDRFVSFMAFSSMAGTALGIIALIVVLSIMNGFHSELRERILSLTPHLILTDSDNKVKNWQTWLYSVMQVSDVISASPIVQQQGLISADKEVLGVQILGIDPKFDTNVSKLSSIMAVGKTDELLAGKWQIVLGQELVDSLDLELGDKVRIIAPPSTLSPLGFVPRIKQFTLSGIFSAGMYEFDSGLAVINIKDAQLLFQLKQEVTGIQIKAKNMFKLRNVKQDIASAIGETAYILDWRQKHSNLFSAIALEKRMMFIVLILMVAVAIFNIITSMVMIVNDKRSDIAILRTIGMRTAGIRLTFFIQGLIIGTIGVIIGLILGIFIAANIEHIMPVLESLFGIKFFPEEIFYISNIPSEIQANDIFFVAGTSLLLTVLATIYPASKAANVQPAEALRYE